MGGEETHHEPSCATWIGRSGLPRGKVLLNIVNVSYDISRQGRGQCTYEVVTWQHLGQDDEGGGDGKLRGKRKRLKTQTVYEGSEWKAPPTHGPINKRNTT